VSRADTRDTELKSFAIVLLALTTLACRGPEVPVAPALPTTIGKVDYAHSRLFDFETATFGEPPDGWLVAQTGGTGGGAMWRVMSFAGARVVAVYGERTSTSNFNLLVSHRDFPADVALAVKLRCVEGREDRGGGLLWRARDANNYYVARWNPLERNLRFYKVENGVRSLLRSVDVQCDADRWHDLAVRAKGELQEVSFDGEKLFTVRDATFSQAGKVGLWAKADARTNFDDLRVSWNE
jgi:hypothetical protein